MSETAIASKVEERAAIDGLLARLSKERGTKYTVVESPDHPDLVAEESPGPRRLAIEHTRLVPQDLPSIDVWSRLYKELAARAAGIGGTFFVGPADYGTRFPRSGRLIAAVAEDIVGAIREHPSWAPGVSIRVPVIPAPPEPQVTVVMDDASGSSIIGIPVYGRRLRPEMIEAMRRKVREKVEDLGGFPGVDERILLVDVSRVSAIGLASLEANLYDELELLRIGGLLPVDAVYVSPLRRHDIPRGRFEGQGFSP